MLACLDVDYRDPLAAAAGVLFSDWTSTQVEAELTEVIRAVEPYEPGAFYKRELPCLLALLAQVPPGLEAIIIDGYVDLAPGRPGLGRRLFESIGVPVVGVAKKPFFGATHAVPILRGTSARPLWVTAAGRDPQEAAKRILAMAGPDRIPTMLRRVDRLCRNTPIAALT